MNEKCFCHIEHNGEKYVVKDKEARERITVLENQEVDLSNFYNKEEVDSMVANAGSIPTIIYPLTYTTTLQASEYNEFCKQFEDIINSVEFKQGATYLINVKDPATSYNCSGLYDCYVSNPTSSPTFTQIENKIVSNDETNTKYGKFTVYGDYVDGYYTVTRIAFMKSGSTKVLTTYNNASYTPSSNYHPATKKYVDDKIAEGLAGITGDGDGSTIVIDPTPTESSNNAVQSGGVWTEFHNRDLKISEIEADINDLNDKSATRDEIQGLTQDIANLETTHSEQIQDVYETINGQHHAIDGLYFLELPYSGNGTISFSGNEDPNRLLTSGIVTMSKTMYLPNTSILLKSSTTLGHNVMVNLETDLTGTNTPETVVFSGNNKGSKTTIKFNGSWSTEEVEGETVYNFSCTSVEIEEKTGATLLFSGKVIGGQTYNLIDGEAFSKYSVLEFRLQRNTTSLSLKNLEDNKAVQIHYFESATTPATNVLFDGGYKTDTTFECLFCGYKGVSDSEFKANNYTLTIYGR